MKYSSPFKTQDFEDTYTELVLKRLTLVCIVITAGISGWFDINIFPLTGNHVLSASLAAIVVNQDITKSKLAEEALKRSEEKYRTLVESIPDYVMRYDRQHRHIFANSRTFQANNLTPEEFIGKTHLELGFDPHLCTVWEKAIDKVFETGQPQLEVFEWVDAYGAKMTHEWRVYPEYAPDGRIETLVGISRDITERKQVEDELKKYREHLEELVRERTAELKNKNEELEKFNKLFVGRELRMIELKSQIEELKKRSDHLKIQR